MPFFFYITSMEDSRPFPSPLMSLMLFLMGMALNVGISLYSAAHLEDTLSWPTITWLNHTLAYGFTVCVALYFLVQRGPSPSTLFSKGDFCWCMTPSLVALALLAIIIFWPLSSLLPEGYYEYVLRVYTTKSLVLFFVLVITGPILEEVLFRGIILRGSLSYLSPWLAIILSAALFAFSHFTAPQIVAALIMGMGMGWLYAKTGSILPAILVHIVYNGGTYMLRFLYTEGEIRALLSGDRGFINGLPWYILWAIALVLALFIGRYLARQVQAHVMPLDA